MLTVFLSLQFRDRLLFSHVDLQFTKGNCYGIIGANGAGKSTFLKILSGDLEATTGAVTILPELRMSVLKQDQNMYDAYTVLRPAASSRAWGWIPSTTRGAWRTWTHG